MVCLRSRRTLPVAAPAAGDWVCCDPRDHGRAASAPRPSASRPRGFIAPTNSRRLRPPDQASVAPRRPCALRHAPTAVAGLTRVSVTSPAAATTVAEIAGSVTSPDVTVLTSLSRRRDRREPRTRRRVGLTRVSVTTRTCRRAGLTRESVTSPVPVTTVIAISGSVTSQAVTVITPLSRRRDRRDRSKMSSARWGLLLGVAPRLREGGRFVTCRQQATPHRQSRHQTRINPRGGDRGTFPP